MGISKNSHILLSSETDNRFSYNEEDIQMVSFKMEKPYFDEETNEQPKQRKKRSDAKVNVNPALPQGDHEKLKRLALACGMTKTSTAAEIISIFVNNPTLINYLQDKHNAKEFRIVPLVEKGKVHYSQYNDNSYRE